MFQFTCDSKTLAEMNPWNISKFMNRTKTVLLYVVMQFHLYISTVLCIFKNACDISEKCVVKIFIKNEY